MRSSDHNPYTGKLSEKDNVLAAIELAKLAKDFADKGMTDEAMDEHNPSKETIIERIVLWFMPLEEVEMTVWTVKACGDLR